MEKDTVEKVPEISRRRESNQASGVHHTARKGELLTFRYNKEQQNNLRKHCRSLNISISDFLRGSIEQSIKNSMYNESLIIGSLNNLKSDIDLIKNMQFMIFQFMEDAFISYLGHTAPVPETLKKASHDSALKRYERFTRLFAQHLHGGNTIEKLLALYISSASEEESTDMEPQGADA